METLSSPKDKSKRPNAPARDYIVCEYGEGYITFTLPRGIYSVSLHLYNDSFSWTGLATVDSPTVEIPVVSGEYTLNCVADDGRVFSGTLEF